jgi:hypothetical protein
MKLEKGATWSSKDVASAKGFQLSAGLRRMFMELSTGENRVGELGGNIEVADLILPFVKLACKLDASESVMLLGVILANVSALEPLPYTNRIFNKVPDPMFSPREALNHERLIEPFELAVAEGVEKKLPKAGWFAYPVYVSTVLSNVIVMLNEPT